MPIEVFSRPRRYGMPEETASFECLNCHRTLLYVEMSPEVEICGTCFDWQMSRKQKGRELVAAQEKENKHLMEKQAQGLNELRALLDARTRTEEKKMTHIEINDRLIHIDNILLLQKYNDKGWGFEPTEERKVQYSLLVTVRTGETLNIPCSDKARMDACYIEIVRAVEKDGALVRLET